MERPEEVQIQALSLHGFKSVGKLLDSVLFSLSAKWAFMKPTFPGGCEKFIIMYEKAFSRVPACLQSIVNKW